MNRFHSMLLVSLVWLAPCYAGETENIAIVRAMVEAINNRDLDALDNLVAANVVRTSAATASVTVNSLEEFKAFLVSDFSTVPDSVMSIDIIFGNDHSVAMRAIYSGTQTGQMGPFPPSGKYFELPFIGILKLKDGKISEIWVEWDNLYALGQLGHFPDSAHQQQDAIVEDTEAALKSVLVNDYEINYLDIGDGEPVVFVHGGLGDYRTWEAQMDAFSKDYRVIAMSRRYAYPNKQEANDSNDYSVTPHAEDLAQFLKSIDLGPVHLVGHSYGGFASLLTALEHPELLRSLTLGEPPVMSMLANIPEGGAAGNEFAQNVLAPTAEAFLSGNDEKSVELFIGGVLGDKEYFSNASQQQKELMMNNAFGLRGVILTETPFPPLDCESARNLQTPTLLITGERSPRLFGEIANVLTTCIEGSEIAMLPNASHGLEYENPVDFNKIALDFIGKH